MNKEIRISYREIDSWETLSEKEKTLINKALEAKNSSHSPYSSFKVGAALELESGEYVLGSNQENVAFPSSMCAERTALFNWASSLSSDKIVRMCIVGEGDFQKSEEPISPCGSCRQVMVEMERRQNHAIQLYMVGKNKKTYIFQSLADLVPLAFT